MCGSKRYINEFFHFLQLVQNLHKLYFLLQRDSDAVLIKLSILYTQGLSRDGNSVYFVISPCINHLQSLFPQLTYHIILM